MKQSSGAQRAAAVGHFTKTVVVLPLLDENTGVMSISGGMRHPRFHIQFNSYYSRIGSQDMSVEFSSYGGCNEAKTYRLAYLGVFEHSINTDYAKY